MKEFLKEVSIFSKLNDEELNLLIKTTHEKFYPKDSFVVRKDDAGTSLFLIRSGEVKIVLEEATGGEIPLSMLGEGSFFGEISLFDGRPRSATVIAQKDTTIVEISREDFLQQITTSPEIALKILVEMASRFRRTDETIRAFAGKVSREAYINLEKILTAQLESAKTIFQKTEDRASKTIDHVESSRKTLTLIASIIIGVFSTIGGVLGYFGFTSYFDIKQKYEEIEDTGKNVENILEKTEKKYQEFEDKIESTEKQISENKNVREIMLGIRKVWKDITLDEEIEDMDTETLKMAAIKFRKSKEDLFEYLKEEAEYEPEVKLEALLTFNELVRKGEIVLKQNEKDNVLTSLLGILKTCKDEDWRTRLIVREELIELGKDEQFSERFIWRELQDIVSDESTKHVHVRENAARILATLGKSDNNTKKVLMHAMKKGKRGFRGNNAAIALLQMEVEEGWKHILESIERVDVMGFWAAYLFGQLLMEKTPKELGWKGEIDLYKLVIDRINYGVKDTNLNKYMRSYAERIVKELKNKLGK